MKKIIILIGVPGSGKGTQALTISKKYGHAHISSGNLLRALLEDPHGDPEDKNVAALINEGKMVPDWLIYKLVFGEIEKNMASGDGVVLDGAIRTVEQAKTYQTFFEEKGFQDEVVVIEPHISDDVALERLLYRKAHSTEARSDDADESIMKQRIEQMGNKKIQPILDFYESIALLQRVDGTKDIQGVEEEIKQVLES